jgi:hypothetical protein
MSKSEPIIIQKEIDDAISKEFDKMLKQHKSNNLLNLLISSHNNGKKISDLPVDEIKDCIGE